mmetsp:Transcript_3952/g.12835  ORF Transcript_3952/g.12835 Transcript_3952/m.12835 type:complete len:359 (+) Transcript_3952:1480-2556(+)
MPASTHFSLASSSSADAVNAISGTRRSPRSVSCALAALAVSKPFIGSIMRSRRTRSNLNRSRKRSALAPSDTVSHEKPRRRSRPDVTASSTSSSSTTRMFGIRRANAMCTESTPSSTLTMPPAMRAVATTHSKPADRERLSITGMPSDDSMRATMVESDESAEKNSRTRSVSPGAKLATSSRFTSYAAGTRADALRDSRPPPPSPRSDRDLRRSMREPDAADMRPPLPKPPDASFPCFFGVSRAARPGIIPAISCEATSTSPCGLRMAMGSGAPRMSGGKTSAATDTARRAADGVDPSWSDPLCTLDVRDAPPVNAADRRDRSTCASNSVRDLERLSRASARPSGWASRSAAAASPTR